MTRRRILVINPNSSASVTAAIDEAVAPLRIAGGPDIEVVGLAEDARHQLAARCR